MRDTTYDSVYPAPAGARHSDRYYGTFRGCRILGFPCSITVKELPDGSPEALDILGLPSFRRSGLAIHISGLNDYGQKTGPGWIRAMGMYSVAWDRHEGDHPSGLGCHKPEAVAIVTSDPRDWEHYALFGSCDGFVTLEGVRRWSEGREKFNSGDVLEAINVLRRAVHKSNIFDLGAQQQRAISNLLEAGIGKSVAPTVWDGETMVRAYLVRFGRWSYCWKAGKAWQQ